MSEATIVALPAALPVARAADFLALLKPRVMSLVIFTGFVGLALAPGDLHPVIAFTALLCIAIGAGAAAPSTCGTTPTSTPSWPGPRGGPYRKVGSPPARPLDSAPRWPRPRCWSWA